jgi:hypothetical protein
MNKPLENQKPYSDFEQTDSNMLETLQLQTFDYFLKNFNPNNGLIADKSQPDSPSSIAVVGLGLCCYVVGVERGLFRGKILFGCGSGLTLTISFI